MFNFIADVLAFFYDLFPSYGLAIVGLTLAVMIVATPLTLKSTKGRLERQKLAPEMRTLQNEYRNDRTKLNDELL